MHCARMGVIFRLNLAPNFRFVRFLICRGSLRALFLIYGCFSIFRDFTGTPNRAETPRAEISVANEGPGKVIGTLIEWGYNV